MFLLDDILGSSKARRQSGRVPTTAARCELLAITPDTRLYSSLQYAADQQGWTVRWANSLSVALTILGCQTIPVVLYDWCEGLTDWTEAIDRIKMLPHNPCVVLAAGKINENLWRYAIGRRAYDVVCRTGKPDELFTTLGFAWKWKTAQQARSRRDGNAA
jgi:DNA-binding NtrC family response regulator